MKTGTTLKDLLQEHIDNSREGVEKEDRKLIEALRLEILNAEFEYNETIYLKISIDKRKYSLKFLAAHGILHVSFRTDKGRATGLQHEWRCLTVLAKLCLILLVDDPQYRQSALATIEYFNKDLKDKIETKIASSK
ncbi:hypothetical protein [Aneurinibacillus tyrosinisolvens]|uniref:hypothetical protein n=1 Tax=Aneurinibacillus tyrosinisolvens TaxID=1443435 RepID=UPI00063EE3F2|nr:hypothetical protein [Aneurinibacillus tyrosinisolvens]